MSDWKKRATKVEATSDWKARAQPIEPEAPLLPEPTEPVGRTPNASQGESLLQGYGQGASFGFSDELGGVAHQGVKALGGGAVEAMKSAPGRALLRRLVPAFRDAPDMIIDAALDQSADEAAGQVLGVQPRMTGGPGVEGAGYVSGRDQMRSTVAEAQLSNPKTFFAGNVAGAMSVPMPGGAAKPFQTVIGRSLENAAKFGGAGAVAGFGNSDADLLKGEYGELAEDTAIGAGIGGGMGFATGPASYAWARHARPALESLARSSAVSAVAPTAGLINRLRKAGHKNEPEMHELGQEILDMRILRPFGGAAAAQERSAAILAEEGANIGGFLDKADDLVSQGVARPPSRDLQRAAISNALTNAADTPATQTMVPQLEAKLLERTGRDPTAAPSWLTGGKPGSEWWDPTPPSTFREMWKNKSQLQQALKPDEFANLDQQLYRQGVKGYTKGVYNQVEGALGPDDVDALRKSAGRYGTASDIDDLLREQVTRGGATQTIGLGDAARGAAVGGGTGGAVATLISALMRGRTASTVATGANALAKVRSSGVRSVEPFTSSVLKGGSEAVRAVSEEEEDAVKAFLSGG